jgi:hypothetical protein
MLCWSGHISRRVITGESGFGGDEARWERARRPIISAIDCDGTFLDVGCANGLLSLLFYRLCHDLIPGLFVRDPVGDTAYVLWGTRVEFGAPDA